MNKIKLIAINEKTVVKYPVVMETADSPIKHWYQNFSFQ